MEFSGDVERILGDAFLEAKPCIYYTQFVLIELQAICLHFPKKYSHPKG